MSLEGLPAQEAAYRAARNGRTEEIGESLGAIPDYPVEVLPVAARSLLACGTEAGLPPALLGGAALAAMAAAVGPGAELEVSPTWHERAILWVPLIAPRGAGKSPAQELAFEPLRSHDADLDDDADEGAEVRFGDLTVEALARSLHAAEGAGVLDLDELAVMLRGFGEYKRGGGGDRGRFLALWSGAPWSFSRVGGGGKANKVRLRISRPTLVIAGGLQPPLHGLLGGEEDGLRPRWLPHLAAMPSETGSLGQTRRPNDWRSLIADHLLPRRHDERVWTVGAGTVAAFEAHRKRWKTQARRFESASTSAALVKADVHLARIALVLAEAQAPGRGGEVPVGVIERAAEIVDFTLNCWRALPEQGGLALSRRDQQLDASIGRLVAWLDERGGKASRRDIQRACVAGVRTATDLDALLRRYEDMFPGTVSTEDQEGGRGLPTVVVAAPARRPVPKVSANPDTLVTTNEIPHCDAENGAVGTADTLSPDTLIADTLNRTVSRGCAAHPDGPRKGCRYCIRCQA